MPEVERTEQVDLERLTVELTRRETPLVIAGGVSAWPAVSRWSPEYLCRLLGPIEIAFKSSSSNAHPDFRQRAMAAMFARGRAPLSEFFRHIVSGPVEERSRCLFTGDERFLLRRRSGETSVDPELSPLLSDIEIPTLFPSEQLHTVWAWFSGLGVRTWLHYDNNGCHNLNAQITGRKRCTLYPPHELHQLHVFPLGGSNPAYNCSRIDVERPGADASSLASATAWQAELEPGDLLFIPAWWLHTFLHTGEFNSNVNFWWRPSRPVWNVVAARQALVDAASAAQLDATDPVVAAALGALDGSIQRL